ncbi:MAG TPA: prefoldin subunit beta [Methanomicrobiales archaeon]|nr:prefoldin subunit beta [Methanomicrobiales archaeon]
MQQIPPKVQNQLAMLQQIQQQMQTVLGQKAQYEMALREAKKASEELKDIPEDAEVFSNIGTVMIQQKKGKVEESLNERIETLELRIKSLEKQERALQTRFDQLSAQVRGALGGGESPPNAE